MNKLLLFNDWWRNREYLVFYLSLFFFLSVCSMRADVRGHGSCCIAPHREGRGLSLGLSSSRRRSNDAGPTAVAHWALSWGHGSQCKAYTAKPT